MWIHIITVKEKTSGRFIDINPPVLDPFVDVLGLQMFLLRSGYIHQLWLSSETCKQRLNKKNELYSLLLEPYTKSIYKYFPVIIPTRQYVCQLERGCFCLHIWTSSIILIDLVTWRQNTRTTLNVKCDNGFLQLLFECTSLKKKSFKSMTKLLSLWWLFWLWNNW